LVGCIDDMHFPITAPSENEMNGMDVRWKSRGICHNRC